MASSIIRINHCVLLVLDQLMCGLDTSYDNGLHGRNWPLAKVFVQLHPMAQIHVAVILCRLPELLYTNAPPQPVRAHLGLIQPLEESRTSHHSYS